MFTSSILNLSHKFFFHERKVEMSYVDYKPPQRLFQVLFFFLSKKYFKNHGVDKGKRQNLSEELFI